MRKISGTEYYLEIKYIFQTISKDILKEENDLSSTIEKYVDYTLMRLRREYEDGNIKNYI